MAQRSSADMLGMRSKVSVARPAVAPVAAAPASRVVAVKASDNGTRVRKIDNGFLVTTESRDYRTVSETFVSDLADLRLE